MSPDCDDPIASVTTTDPFPIRFDWLVIKVPISWSSIASARAFDFDSVFTDDDFHDSLLTDT